MSAPTYRIETDGTLRGTHVWRNDVELTDVSEIDLHGDMRDQPYVDLSITRGRVEQRA